MGRATQARSCSSPSMFPGGLAEVEDMAAYRGAPTMVTVPLPDGSAQALVSTVANIEAAITGYDLERCRFSRAICSGDQPRTSVNSIHASV